MVAQQDTKTGRHLKTVLRCASTVNLLVIFTPLWVVAFDRLGGPAGVNPVGFGPLSLY
jgi:hypothetical protein